MGVPQSGTWRGGRWELVPALIALEAEADLIAPRRRRTSDGSIGDAAHAARASNHNPQESGKIDWVDSIDISHDPANGMDIHARCRQLVAALDDRLDEVISNRQIWTRARSREGWRPYSGSNPHTLHAHITVRDSHRHSTRPWFTGSTAFATPGPPPHTPPTTKPPQSEEDDDMKPVLIRLHAPGHPHHGRVEVVDDFTRRHIATSAELMLQTFRLGAPANLDAAGWNTWTANKQVIDAKGVRA